MADDPLLEVAQDLREIRRLADELAEQALHKADDIDIPGGDALVALGPVAHQAAWEARRLLQEKLWWENPDGALPEERPNYLADEELTNPLQLLLFWSEAWRTERGLDKERLHPVTSMWLGPTLKTEAKWLADNLRWIYDTEPHFDDFARDIHQARTTLERILMEGERETLGIQCPSCKQRSLIRVAEDRLRRQCKGHEGVCRVPSQGCCDRGGLQERWECPVCHHTMNLKDYQSAVMRDYIAHAPWLSARYVERRTGVKAGTVRVWVSREYVRAKKDPEGTTVYNIADIEARLEESDGAA